MANGWQVPSYSMYGQTWNQQGYGMEWVFFLSIYFLHLLSEIQLSRKTPSTSIFSPSHDFWPLSLCVFAGSLSHRAGWEGLARSLLRLQPRRVQSCPTWATTTWQGIKHSEPGVKQRGFFSFSFSFYLVNWFGTKRQGLYSQSLFSWSLLFNNRFIFTLVFYAATFFHPEFFNTLYIYIYKKQCLFTVVWTGSALGLKPIQKQPFLLLPPTSECVNKDVWHSFNLRPVVFSSSLTHLVYWPTAWNIDQEFLPRTFFFEY